MRSKYVVVVTLALLQKYYNSQPLAIDFLRCYPYLSRLATQIIKKSQVRACNSNLEPPKYELEV